MSPELMEKIRKDYEREPDKDLHWEAYVAGYLAGVRRFAERPNRKEIQSKLGYSRVGLNNV